MASVTSREWWAKVKQDPAAIRRWLLGQYRGESTAAGRIDKLRNAHAEIGTPQWDTLTTIAGQERKHAGWMYELLSARGIEAKVEDRPERYWEKTLHGIVDLVSGAAVAAHAEKMRLERIEAIVEDIDAPTDIRDVFARVLPDELFHERAFREMAGPVAMKAAARAHADGRNALGLVA
jgi:rubrerythrin